MPGRRYTPTEMIAKLVSFDTVSRNSNHALIDFVKDYLDGWDVPSLIVPNADGSKANLIATVGPNEPGGVVLSGHSDVVPVDGQPWDTDPFEVIEEKGKLYGRGTADMKSFSAIALALVPEMLANNLKRPIHIALTYDEEVGCYGAPPLIERIKKDVPLPEMVIVGEPTSMDIIDGVKGIATMTTRVTGRESHSCYADRSVSAVTTAARLVAFIADMMTENKANADPASRFDPPCTTLHVGKINGGTAFNIVARECSFDWDIRYIPTETAQMFLDRFQVYADKLLAENRKIAPEVVIETEIFSQAPPLLPETDGQADELCRTLTGGNRCYTVAYAAEAGQYQEAGFSTVMCGPGSIKQAHQPNEFIELTQVVKCEAFMRSLMDRLSK